MLKVIVIDSPSVGKSTFAKKLRDITKLPLFYLDMLWHKPDKTNISKEEFDIRLDEIMKSSRWIIDGNYQRTLEIRLKKSDTVFLLEICLLGAEARIGIKREDLPRLKLNLMKNLNNTLLIFQKNNCLRYTSCWINIERIRTLSFLNQEKKLMII